MPTYSPKLLDHFQNPRNTGDIAGAEAVAEMENPVCGDVLRLSLRIKNEQISEARFKARGCVPSIACGSALTELITHKSVVEARRLTFEDLISSVGGVPPASNHAAQLALDVLRAALNAAGV